MTRKWTIPESTDTTRPRLTRMAAGAAMSNDCDAARAAGVRSIGVTWGIHPRARMEHLGFSALIDRPEQLLSLIG